MTNIELRKLLEQYPDDARVFHDGIEFHYIKEDGFWKVDHLEMSKADLGLLED
jgi:hypothetical protein